MVLSSILERELLSGKPNEDIIHHFILNESEGSSPQYFKFLFSRVDFEILCVDLILPKQRVSSSKYFRLDCASCCMQQSVKNTIC